MQTRICDEIRRILMRRHGHRHRLKAIALGICEWNQLLDEIESCQWCQSERLRDDLLIARGVIDSPRSSEFGFRYLGVLVYCKESSGIEPLFDTCAFPRTDPKYLPASITVTADELKNPEKLDPFKVKGVEQS